jgi:hypothetical protein
MFTNKFSQIFKMVTRQFSSDTPCLASVILAMDKMHHELTAASQNTEYLPTLRIALRLGTKLLNKYYSLTDDSDVYRIAMDMSHFTQLHYTVCSNVRESSPSKT